MTQEKVFNNVIKDEFYQDFKDILKNLHPTRIQNYWTYNIDTDNFVSPILTFKSNQFFNIKMQIYYTPASLNYSFHFYFTYHFPETYYPSFEYPLKLKLNQIIPSFELQLKEMVEGHARHITHKIFTELEQQITKFLNTHYISSKDLNLYPQKETA